MNFNFILNLFFILVFFSSCQEETKEDRPNILFILADDLRADAIAANGNQTIETPNIDQLYKNGFSFSNAYCMGSHHGAVCAPSRSMMLTGKTLNHVYADLDTVDILPQFLQKAGYTTFATGKYHTDFYERTSRDFKGWDYGENIMFGGMSDHNKVPIQNQISYDKFTEKKLAGFSSVLFADAAIKFINDYKYKNDDSMPFYSYVSFTAPHDPRTPPDDWLNMYNVNDITLPKNYKTQHPFDTGWMKGRDEILAAWPRHPTVIKHQIAEYYGLISHMDYEIGRIINALKETNQFDNTIIIFASDHGLAMGSHGLLGKQNLYEHSTKAPLVIMGPDIPKNESSKAFVYLLDIFGTIMNFAGADMPANRESLNLCHAWTTENFIGRPKLFTTYEDIQRAIRIEEWKLIRYPKTHYNQLFNLKKDPDELWNLANSMEYEDKLNEMMVALEEAQEEFDDPHPLTVEPQVSMFFDPKGIQRKVDKHQPEWVVKKYFSDVYE